MSVHPQHEGETEVRQHPDVDPAVKDRSSHGHHTGETAVA